jgi:hypothetical protein
MGYALLVSLVVFWVYYTVWIMVSPVIDDNHPI